METTLSFIASTIFLVGAIINGTGPKPLRAQYAAWGFPSWFRYVTSILELTAAVLLFFPATRIAGAILGAAVMLAAVATLVRGSQYLFVPAPVLVLVLTILTGWTAT